MKAKSFSTHEVLTELEKVGTAQNRKIYQRHGSGPKLFGVSFANLNILKKKIKRDQDLADELWETENVDAQTLATMIAVPETFTSKKLEYWLKGLTYYLLVDLFVKEIVAKTVIAEKKMKTWLGKKDEWVGRAGYMLCAELAMTENEVPEETFSSILKKIANEIHSSPNRKKEAMNYALISVGGRSDALRKEAVETSKKIGKVTVDHGDTSCKTPDAIPYIEKIWLRKGKKFKVN